MAFLLSENAMKQFEGAVILISGFCQSTRSANGIEKLWRDLRPMIPLETHFMPHPFRWCARHGDTAEFLQRNLDPVAGKVIIVSYSWGSGHGARKLAAELHKRGIPVPHFIAADPVFHSWLRPWRGLFPAIWNGPITLSKNVWHAASFIQRQNRPQGTTLKLKNPMGTVDEPVMLDRNHQNMDDAPEFHRLVIRTVRNSCGVSGDDTEG